MASKEFDRRAFIITVASTTAALAGAGLLLSEFKSNPVETGSRIEPNTQKALRHFTFANLMKDYPVVIDGSVLERESQNRNVPLGNAQNTVISLLPGIKLPSGGVIDIIKQADEEQIKIRIAGGVMDEVVKKLSGSAPNDWKEQGYLSAHLSDQIFQGLASRGFLLGHYSESESKNKSEAYLNSILSSNNPPLIAHMLITKMPGLVA